MSQGDVPFPFTCELIAKTYSLSYHYKWTIINPRWQLLPFLILSKEGYIVAILNFRQVA